MWDWSASPEIVYTLTSIYDLSNASTPHFHRLGEPCHGDSQYLYMPLANGWDCYKHETYDRIDDWFRSPCACREPEAMPVRRAVLFGVAMGVVGYLITALLGAYWEGARQFKGSADHLRFDTNVRMMACGLLYVAQQVLLLVPHHLHVGTHGIVFICSSPVHTLQVLPLLVLFTL